MPENPDVVDDPLAARIMNDVHTSIAKLKETSTMEPDAVLASEASEEEPDAGRRKAREKPLHAYRSVSALGCHTTTTADADLPVEFRKLFLPLLSRALPVELVRDEDALSSSPRWLSPVTARRRRHLLRHRNPPCGTTSPPTALEPTR